MARQRDAKLIGTVGNIIFYQFRGEFCMRTKPVSVRRTGASVKSGFNFGKASKMSRQIRNLISTINPCKSDNRVMCRLTGTLNKLISWKEKLNPATINKKDALPYISGFQFNDRASLSEIWAIRVFVTQTGAGNLEITLDRFSPTQSLHAPNNTNRILFRLKLIGASLDDPETKLIGTADLEIPFTAGLFQPPPILMPDTSKQCDLKILVMAVQYMVNNKGIEELLTNKKKLPCGIVWAEWN